MSYRTEWRIRHPDGVGVERFSSRCAVDYRIAAFFDSRKARAVRVVVIELNRRNVAALRNAGIVVKGGAK